MNYGRQIAFARGEKHMVRIVLAALAASLLLIAHVAGAAAAGPKDGLYLMLRYWSGTLELDAYYFKGGQVVRGPMGNIATLDFAALRSRVPYKVGEVAMAGNKMRIEWGDGTASENTFEPEANGACFGFDAGTFCPVTGFAPGEKLSGSFEGGLRAGNDRTAVGNVRTIVFSSDGTYRMDAMATELDLEQKSDQLLAWSAGNEQGTYELDGTALKLDPVGRKPYVVLTFPYDVGGNPKTAPDHIYFGGTMLKRL
jgi:hypothetical protein